MPARVVGVGGGAGGGGVRQGRESLGERVRSVLAFSSAVVGGRAVDRLLDPVELADAVERLVGDRRAGGGVHVEELAAHMRPTGGLDDPIASEQLVEPSIAIGMDDATKVLQVSPRVFALAVR